MRRSGRQASARLSDASDHLHPVLRPQRDRRLRYHGMFGHQLEPPLLRECCHQQHQLHPGERLTNALTRPAAEGEVGKPRQGSLDFGCPSVGVEALGIDIMTSIALHNPLAHDDDGTWRDIVAADAVLVDRSTCLLYTSDAADERSSV